MLPAQSLLTAATFCVASALIGTAAQAQDYLAQYQTPAPPATTAPELDQTVTIDLTTDETANVAQREPLTCPPGQFPSAFADVYPFHWAYQAINNLASPSMQCFDLPEEYR
ncbi:MAG: hypothetical protein ACFBSG_07680 [Leptolyngbyaceae cyanobacterium]